MVLHANVIFGILMPGPFSLKPFFPCGFHFIYLFQRRERILQDDFESSFCQIIYGYFVLDWIHFLLFFWKSVCLFVCFVINVHCKVYIYDTSSVSGYVTDNFEPQFFFYLLYVLLLLLVMVLKRDKYNRINGCQPIAHVCVFCLSVEEINT